MSRKLIVPAIVAVLSTLVFLAPAQAAGPCTTTVGPGGTLQVTLSAAAPNDVVCLSSGTYAIHTPLTLPGPISIVGVGATTPVLDCTGATYCLNASMGPSFVDLENLVVRNAKKMNIVIGSAANPAPVTDWTMTGLAVTGAGNVGIVMNNAARIALSDSTISGNGSNPYGKKDHTGDFGIRTTRVDTLSVTDSVFTDNVTTKASNDGNAAGAKFNNDTNVIVTGNAFSGNGGGGQLWLDIDSVNFDVEQNTVSGATNAVTGGVANDAIRVEVSCAGSTGGVVAHNVVVAGTTAGIDLFDASGIQVLQNDVTVPAKGKYGIRMYGNAHEAQPATGCDTAGVFPNTNNIATGNAITDTTPAGSALNGVVNDPGGVTFGNVWSANSYTRPHCADPNWLWWDGIHEQHTGFDGWQGFGQDPSPDATCSATAAEVSSFEPPTGESGTVVTIAGSGLTGASAVTFNGIGATQFSVDSDAQITATVPDGPTTGAICVQTNRTLCTTSYFIDTAGGGGAAAALVPASGGPGTTVVIQGAGLATTTGVTFSNGLPATFAVISDNEVDATAPGGVATGPVCMQLADTSSACTPGVFTVVKPVATKITSPSATFQMSPYSLIWKSVLGADSYQVRSRSAPYNGNYPAAWSTSNTTGTSLSFPATPGQTTCFKVATLNSAGSSLSGQTCTAVPLDDRGLKVGNGAWTKPTASRYYQGTAMVSQAKNATLTLAGVQAKTIALVVEIQPGGGSVQVLLGGKSLGTFSTAGPLNDGTLLTVMSGNAVQKGNLTIKVTTGGKPVAIDGVGLYRG